MFMYLCCSLFASIHANGFFVCINAVPYVNSHLHKQVIFFVCDDVTVGAFGFDYPSPPKFKTVSYTKSGIIQCII